MRPNGGSEASATPPYSVHRSGQINRPSRPVARFSKLLKKIFGKSYEKLKKILRKTYDELTEKLLNAKKGLKN